MHKIIKSYETEEDRILEYVRTPQESMNPDDLSGGSYVDPAAILAEARTQAELLVEESYAKGMSRGVTAGEQQFAESVGQAAAMIGEVAQQLNEHRASYVENIESQVVALTHLVASKILGREVAASPELVNGMVHGAVERLSMEERVRVRVNSSDLDRVQATESDLREQFTRITHLEIIADDSIETGGCVAESDALYVDAQLSAQLNEVIDGLNDNIAEGEGDD